MSAPQGSARPAPADAASTVAWLVQHAPVSPDAQAAVAGAGDADAMLDTLLQAGHLADALRVMAVALPPREGAWWAWAAASHVAKLAGEGNVPPEAVAALDALARWIGAPDDQTRRAAWAASEKAGMDTAAGCAAAIPFFTAGSIAPADVAVIPPPPAIYTTLVATTVLLASTADMTHFEAMARAYVAQGREIVKQLGGFGPSVQASHAHLESQREQHRRATEAQAGATTAPSPGPPR